LRLINCCWIQYPDSQEKKGLGGKEEKASSKIFVGRITENLTKEDLMDHFNNFGRVTDVYIPNPFRHFAFVQV
jgi:RNA recognition motif-containing protein